MWTKSLLMSGIFASALLALSGSSARAESIGLEGALSLGYGGVRRDAVQVAELIDSDAQGDADGTVQARRSVQGDQIIELRLAA